MAPYEEFGIHWTPEERVRLEKVLARKRARDQAARSRPLTKHERGLRDLLYSLLAPRVLYKPPRFNLREHLGRDSPDFYHKHFLGKAS